MCDSLGATAQGEDVAGQPRTDYFASHVNATVHPITEPEDTPWLPVTYAAWAGFKTVLMCLATLRRTSPFAGPRGGPARAWGQNTLTYGLSLSFSTHQFATS